LLHVLDRDGDRVSSDQPARVRLASCSDPPLELAEALHVPTQLLT
jgi:hypothetical protein